MYADSSFLIKKKRNKHRKLNTIFLCTTIHDIGKKIFGLIIILDN